MKFNIARISALMALAFALGWISYSEFTDFNSPATLYNVGAGDTVAFLGGNWVVADVSGSARNTMIEKDSAQALVGKLALVNDHEFDFDDMRCPTSFARTVEHPLAFLHDYGTSPFFMHLHMPNTRIDLGCADVYPLAHDMILIAYEGYFLDAVRKPIPAR
jgi:hypothetical protein